MGNAKTKAQNKYISKNYDRINLIVPKGKKNLIENYAKKNGESVTKFLNRIIDEALSKENLD